MPDEIVLSDGLEWKGETLAIGSIFRFLHPVRVELSIDSGHPLPGQNLRIEIFSFWELHYGKWSTKVWSDVLGGTFRTRTRFSRTP